MDEVLERLTALVASASSSRDGRLRLPTERELAESLGVSRATVRERLNSLQTLGVIQRTQGSGTYVEMPHSTFLRLYFDIAVKVGAVDLGALEEIRELFEVAAVGQAAERRTEADVARLDHYVDQMLRDPSPAGDEADFQFHLELVHLSGNAMLSLIVEGLAHCLRELLTERRHVVRQLARSRGDAGPSPNDLVHADILDAVRRGDGEAARAAMHEHFRLWREVSTRVESLDEFDTLARPEDLHDRTGDEHSAQGGHQ